MFLKHGSQTTEHSAKGYFDFNCYWCLSSAQQDSGKQPYSTIKTVLIEHMQAHFPGQQFIRPAGVLEIYIPLQFHNKDFCDYYDELAHQLVSYHTTNSGTWSEQGMRDHLKQYPLPETLKQGGKTIPDNVFEKLIDLNAQVHLPNNLLKKDFKVNKSNNIEGRSNPEIAFFQRKTNATDNKMVILKESSETNILLSRLIAQKDDGKKTAQNVVILLNQQLEKNRDKYTPDNLNDAYHYVSWAVDKEDYQRIQVYAPFIHAYLEVNPNAPVEYKTEREQALRDSFKFAIRNERFDAAVAGIFNALLMGPAAPKIKFVNNPTSPNHLKLLSRMLPNSQDYMSLYINKPDLAYAAAPELAAAAIVRLILGCAMMEMKLNNFMCVSIGTVKKVVNVDTDLSFEEKQQNKLKDLTLGLEGAKNMLSNHYKDMKPVWDKIFSGDNHEAVKKSMLDMLKRAAAVLTDPVIDHVLKYVMEQEHEVFAVEESYKDKRAAFLRKSGTLIIDILKTLGEYNEAEDAASLAPWVHDLFEKINQNNTTLKI